MVSEAAVSEVLGARARNALRLSLLRERERLLQTLQTNAEAERAIGESQDGASGWGQEASVASDLVEEELLATLDREEHGRLAEVDAALRRLADGHYGVCQDCDQPIPVARLRAAPWARRCLCCAERTEARSSGGSAAVAGGGPARRRWPVLCAHD